jgi:hypothetical protein
MVPGAALVFYESRRNRGAGAAIAIARIADVTQLSKERIPESVRRGAVVKDTRPLSASDQILVTTFTNLIHFKHPVPLEHLREIGCVGRANLPTATQISDALALIVEAGQTAWVNKQPY